MGALEMLIKNVLDTNYEALPANVVVATKKQILDTLGTTVAGSTSDNIGELVNLVKEWGGKMESTVVAFGGKVPSPNAALLNGVLSMRMDFDDTHDWDRTHPSRTTVPPAFAIAERKGGVNGKDLITAVALGHDLECRITRSAVFIAMLLFGYSAGIFGVAATVGKILGLNEEKLTNALGLAVEQITGAGRLALDYATSAPTKGLIGGLLCRGGVEATLLAESGFTAAGNYLEGPSGFFHSIYRGWYEPSLLTVDLGKDFRGALSSQKEYPCCHILQTSIEATVGIVREHNIRPDDVAEVVVHIPSLSIMLYNEETRIPKSHIAAQFSGFFAIASAIVRPNVGIGNFSEEAIRDKKTLELAEKVSTKIEPELAGVRIGTPASVDIKTKDGRVYSNRVDYPFGSPENPMSFDDVAAKFRHCCEYSVKPISKENQEKVIEMVKGLEEVSDVSVIIRLLA